jgi:hypothetical protein
MDFQSDTSTLGNVSIITPTTNTTLTISSTSALNIPSGTTGQRVSAQASAGALRYNTSISSLEFYTGAAWTQFGAATALSGLTDTTIATPTSGQVLSYNGTKWVNTTQLTSSNLSVRHILLGDSITNANIANVFITGTPSGPQADRPITFIDTSAVMKIVRVGGNPAIELQEWDAGITSRIGYFDIVSFSGQLQFRDRNNDAVTYNLLTLDKVTGNIGMMGNLTALAISGSTITSAGSATVGGSMAVTGPITASNLSGSNTGDQTIILTGDVTGSGTGSFAATLANSGVTAGDYTTVTVDAKGRVTTGATTQAWSTITSTPTTLAGYGITDAALNNGIFTGNVALTTAGTSLTIPAAAMPTPANPTAGNVTIFGKSLANREMLAFVDSDGLDAVLQPAMWRQKVSNWNPPGNSTTVPGVFGMNAPTALGTATARAVATTSLFTRTRRLGYVSQNGSGSFAGHFVSAAQFTTGDGAGLGGFFYSCRFGFSDAAAVTGTRAFVGLTSSTTTPSNVEPSALTNCIGVAQLSSSTTQLYLVYGGSTAQTAIALGTGFPPMAGVGAANGIAYELTIYCAETVNGIVNYRIERLDTKTIVEGVITPGTVGIQTPASSVLLAHRAWRTNNVTAGAVAIDIIGFYTETDY